MSSVTAIYENGVFRPLKEVDLPEATRVEIPLPDRVSQVSRPEIMPAREVLSPLEQTAESHAEWLRELDQRRVRGVTGIRGTPLQEIFDDLRSESGT